MAENDDHNESDMDIEEEDDSDTDSDTSNQEESDSDADISSEDEVESEEEAQNEEFSTGNDNGNDLSAIVSNTQVTYREETINGKKSITVRIGNKFTSEGDFRIFSIDQAHKEQFLSSFGKLGVKIVNQVNDGAPSSSKKKKDDPQPNMEELIALVESLMKTMTSSPGMGGGAGNGNSARKPTVPPAPDPSYTFENIGGLESQISFLRDNVILYLQDPETYKEFNGGSPPKGLLFYGVPGSGKTMLAQAFANELSKQLGENVAFYYRKGPDCFSSYVGETNEILKALFQDAAANKPSVIFFDEIDGLCPSRDRTSSSGGEAYSTVVTTLLGLMDDVIPGDVVVIGATNRLEAVDPAMLRPGRFDKKLVFNPPHELARKKILEINLEKWAESERPSAELISKVAKETTGFTGADLQKLCRDAFLKAFDRHVPDLDMNSNTRGLKVLPEDWTAAMKGMTKTSSLSFGSFLYVPSSMQTEFVPLLSKPTSEILKDLENLSPLRNMKHKNDQQDSMAYNSYLITNKTDLNGSIFDNLIISNLLADEFLSKCPVYIINEDTITQNANYLQAVDQAANAPLSILAILQLDYLTKSYPTEIHEVAKQIKLQFQGKECLILATATCEVGVITISELKEVFTGSERNYIFLSPSFKERKEFFRPIFEEKAFRMDNATENEKERAKKTYAPKIAELEKLCIEETAKSTLSNMMDLYAKLSICTSSFTTVINDDFLQNMENILRSYSYI